MRVTSLTLAPFCFVDFAVYLRATKKCVAMVLYGSDAG